VPLPQVWIVAVPETLGVHWKTFSGEPLEFPQLPASVPVPLVLPVKVPPTTGMTMGLMQVPAPSSQRLAFASVQAAAAESPYQQDVVPGVVMEVCHEHIGEVAAESNPTCPHTGFGIAGHEYATQTAGDDHQPAGVRSREYGDAAEIRGEAAETGRRSRWASQLGPAGRRRTGVRRVPHAALIVCNERAAPVVRVDGNVARDGAAGSLVGIERLRIVRCSGTAP